MIKEKLNWKAFWTIRRYDSKYFEERYDGLVLPKPQRKEDVSHIDHNILVNEGITLVLQLIGGTAAPTQWDNANASLGVGNSATAEAATDTDLIGASKLFRTMETGYPSIAAQTITWRAIFEDGVAEFAWEEFTVVNGADDTAGTMLNRVTSAEGTKTAGQTWTLDLDVTLS